MIQKQKTMAKAKLKEILTMRNKNAARQHSVAPYAGEAVAPATGFEPLAKFITEITDSSDDVTDEFADYAGDGTVQTDVIGIQEAWDVSGTFDITDPAQALIAGMKRATGNGRKVWHKIENSNGTEVVVGVATVLSIVAGSGAADEHEEFSCTLQYDQRPEINSL